MSNYKEGASRKYKARLGARGGDVQSSVAELCRKRVARCLAPLGPHRVAFRKEKEKGTPRWSYARRGIYSRAAHEFCIRFFSSPFPRTHARTHSQLQSTFGEANPSCGVLRLSVCSEMLGLGMSHHREGQDYAKVGTVSPQG